MQILANTTLTILFLIHFMLYFKSILLIPYAFLLFLIIFNKINRKVLHIEKLERNLPSAASLHIFRTFRAVPCESYRLFPRFGAFLNLIVPFFVQFSSAID